jgi:hypothetical protein
MSAHAPQTSSDTLALYNQTIDQSFSDPADRMMMKLYLDQYGLDEIARFAGLPRERVAQCVAQGIRILESRMGCFFGAIQATCVQANVEMRYR